MGKECRMRGMRFAGGLPLLLVGLLCAPGLSLGGGIKGKVVYVGPVPASKKVDVTIDQYVCGTAKDAGDLLISPQKELRNAVAWLENPPANVPWPAGSEKVEMDQQKCEFVPRVVLVPAGGTVDFLNNDRLLHNIHATPKLNVSFNRTQPKSRTIPVTFAKPEIVRITCDLHSWMTGWVVVEAHPFYAITGPDGQFAFDNLPAGQYKLQVWHESLGTVPANVTVGDQQTARVTVEMKAP
jgi:plastocyanin